MKAISIQFFVPEGRRRLARPAHRRAIQQFLRDVDWGELDYLVVDLPPGTSDAQLTLAQAVPISGTVLVTTPQEVALSDVGKALSMLQRLNVPVIGVVENMSAFVCPHCGEETEIFGRGGGERFAEQHGIDFLGKVPLDITVRQGGDAGIPAVAQREPGPAAQALEHVARLVAARMSVRAALPRPRSCPSPERRSATSSARPAVRPARLTGRGLGSPMSQVRPPADPAALRAVLESVPLFRDLSPDDLATLASRLRTALPAG